MEGFVAITNKSNEMYVLIFINSEGVQAIGKKIVREYDIPQAIKGFTPINFSIQNGRVNESMGSIERIIPKDGVQPLVVIQELATSVGTIIGYRLLNPVSNNIVSRKKEDIIDRQAKSGIPILQNGIIRGNKVNCYPNSPFPRFIIGTKTRNSVKKPKLSSQTEQKSKPQQSAKESNNLLDQFTPEQRKELSLAKRDGVDLRLIANPKLSPKQMRVLWVSKKKGAYSEYFARPEYSVEAMTFYADRLMTMNAVKECSDLLSRPEYDVPRLTELYLAVCEGIDYSSFIDDSSAEDMYVKREALRNKLWCSENKASISDSEYINSGVRLADKLKRG